MADTGAPHSLPYPIASDPPAGHTQMQALATQTAGRLGFVGSSIIATSQTRTSSSYGTLSTPDQVTGVVVPTNGIIQVRYWAIWERATAVTGNAAIFIDSTMLTVPRLTGASTATGEASNVGGLDQYLTTYWGGLISTGSGGDSGTVASLPATGSILGAGAAGGGACEIIGLPAGTYTVSVRFKTPSGTLTIENRNLWVRVLVP